MTPEMQKKRDELAAHYSREDLTVKEDFISGFNAAHDLMQDEIFELKDKLHHYFQYIGDDGPEQSCPFVDSVIKRFPETANTMERIRTINVQLRFNLEKERQKVKVLVEALEFYADIKNWEKIEGHTKWASNLMVEDCSLYNCGGGRARQALKGWEG